MTAKAWKAWTLQEDALLCQHWKDRVSTKRLAARFPGRSPAAVIKHGYDMGLGPRECGREKFSPVWEGIKRLLAGGKKMTSNELAKALTVTPHVIQQRMRERHGTEVHIGGYAKVAAHTTRVIRWKLGPGPDVPMPAKKTKQEINREYSHRQRKDPEYCARQNALARKRYAEKTGKLIRPADAAAWLHAAPLHDGPALRANEFRTAASASPNATPGFPIAGMGLLRGSPPNRMPA